MCQVSEKLMIDYNSLIAFLSHSALIQSHLDLSIHVHVVWPSILQPD